MKIAVFSAKSYDRKYFDKCNSSGHFQITYFDASLSLDTVALTAGFHALCLFVNDKVDKEIIIKLAQNGVQIIALRCAGYNNVDIAAAKENNIKLVRVPAYSPQAIAEHAVALILTLSRKTHKAYNQTREGNFSSEKLIGFNLFNKTVGVIGTGRIGSAFCSIMMGFGCKVIAFDIIESATLKETGVTYLPLNEVLQHADILSLHCPLTPDTKYMLDNRAFSQMKKGAMVINTSRGALIKTQDAIEALKIGQVGYLGIDVYEQEENFFFKDLSGSIIQDDVLERLLTFPNVLITPHQGFLTTEALDQIAAITLQNLADFRDGLALKNEVTI